MSENLILSNETVTSVKYFSAYAKWRQQSYRHHQRYVSALQSRGVQFIEGNFKKKSFICKKCDGSFITHEEKETDVNIGVHLIADGLQNRYDHALVISADSDLNQAVGFAKSETENKHIDIVAPPGRMKRNSHASFSITKGKLRNSNSRLIFLPP